VSYLAAFRVTIESVEEACLLRVGGEVDRSTAPELGRHLRAARNSSATTLVDLANVSFIDSVGVQVLVAESEAAVAEGRALFVVRPSHAVRRVLILMGCADRVPVVPATADASLLA
jgi:anti-anti-sigma factor